MTLCLEKGNRFLVKGNKGFSPKPIAFISNGAIGKIPTSFEHR